MKIVEKCIVIGMSWLEDANAEMVVRKKNKTSFLEAYLYMPQSLFPWPRCTVGITCSTRRMPSETGHTYVDCRCDGDASKEREFLSPAKMLLIKVIYITAPSLLHSGCGMTGNGHIAEILLRGDPCF